MSNDGAQRWPSAMLMISLLGVYLTVPDTEVIVVVCAAALAVTTIRAMKAMQARTNDPPNSRR